MPQPWPTAFQVKQQGGQVRLGDVCERQEYERDYAPRDEARVTVSWIRGEAFVMVPGKVSYPLGIKANVLKKWVGHVSIKCPWMNQSGGVKDMLMFNTKICRVLKLLSGPLLNVEEINEIALHRNSSGVGFP